MDVLVKYADSISAVVFWGVTDDQSWRATRLPLLFDAAFQAKPAYYSIVDGLEMPDLPETTTTTTVTTTETTVTSVTGGEYTVLGDTNCDDLFKIADVILLNRFLAEDDAITITDVGMANADFNQDGDINGDDAVAMLKNIAALD